MQGIVAYFYGIIQPNTSIELNSCRYNYMAADVMYTPAGKAWMPSKKNNLESAALVRHPVKTAPKLT